MRKKTVPLVMALLVAAVFSASCSRGLPAEFPAPDFTVEDILTGDALHLATYRGRPVMLYFFASW